MTRLFAKALCWAIEVGNPFCQLLHLFCGMIAQWLQYHASRKNSDTIIAFVY